ncbi:MAG TPA: hypothetical protein VHE80_07285 [Acidimicrobiales bacterium]|nr:hypothetical protein [Acidimicrobiales bacterium]
MAWSPDRDALRGRVAVVAGAPWGPLVAALVTVVLALVGCGSDDAPRGGGAATTTAPPRSNDASLDGADLLRALRGGGFVVYFRHAATESGTDTSVRDLDNCATQRNLSAEGRAQAQEIGRAFRQLGIAVGVAVVRPRDGTFTVVATVSPAEWRSLGR